MWENPWSIAFLLVGLILTAAASAGLYVRVRGIRSRSAHDVEGMLDELKGPVLKLIQAEAWHLACEIEVDDIVRKLPRDVRALAVGRGIIGASVARLGRPRAVDVAVEKDPFPTDASAPASTTTPAASSTKTPMRFTAGGQVFEFSGRFPTRIKVKGSPGGAPR